MRAIALGPATGGHTHVVAANNSLRSSKNVDLGPEYLNATGYPRRVGARVVSQWISLEAFSSME